MAHPKTGADLNSQRGPGRQSEYEQEKVPAAEGESPRPATEPTGSKGSSNSGETATDPATGNPNP